MLDALVTHRLAVYAGGLLLAALPTLLDRGFDVVLAGPLRTVLVALALGTMLLTYAGERRARGTTDPRDATPDYALGTRVAAVGAVAGVALGGYLAATADLLVGVLFVGGGVLFARLAVGGGRGR
ncbi:hypothetical protein [Halomarina ordinaria]|uniref:Uncharacterized protein n=1 Tax=Halomarina ordinaria TaxID=3033939 RepID=A0ABD5U9K0_9EURY|nr:hypothetical protein [Halomarina sp. PSRA2]